MIPEAIPEDRQWAPPSPRVGKDVEAPSSSRRRDIRVPEGIIGDDDFERWLRRKCFVPYWMLHVCLRAIETADVVQSGTGQANAVLMAVFVAALSTAAFASRKEVWSAVVDNGHLGIFAYACANNCLRIARLVPLSALARAREAALVSGSVANPVHYAFTAVHGFGLPLVFGGRALFQAAFASVHVAFVLTTVRVAGADPRFAAPQIATWFAAILAANGVVRGVLRPRWTRARRAADARLRATKKVTWDWQPDEESPRKRSSGDGRRRKPAASSPDESPPAPFRGIPKGDKASGAVLLLRPGSPILNDDPLLGDDSLLSPPAPARVLDFGPPGAADQRPARDT